MNESGSNHESLRSSAFGGFQTAAALTTLIMAHGLTAAARAQTPEAAPSSAGATNAPAQLPEVTVQGQLDPGYKPEAVASPKYTEPLLDVPQTITVIPRSLMDQQGATSLSEALRNIPGITMLAGEGGGASSSAGDTFFMRGFDASNSIFVDGVRSQGLISRDVFNLEQVEVYKGPTGADVGRGTASGYVNLATKSPRLDPFYGGTLGVGTSEMKRLTLDANQPIPLGAEDSWIRGTAFRLNGMWQDGELPGRDGVERNSWALAPSLGFGLGTDTRLIFSTQHTRQDNVPDYGLPGAALNGGIDRDNFYGSLGYDKEDVSQDSYTARIEHDLTENITLRNQTHYSKVDRFAIITSPGNVTSTNTVNRSRQANERINKVFSNQTGATAKFGTGPVDHTVTGGLEYSWEEQFTPAVTGAGTVSHADAFNPNPHDPVAGYDPRRTGAYTEGSTDTVGLYAFDTIDLTPRWQLNGGLRWDNYQTDFESITTTNTYAAGTPIEASGDLLSWKTGLVFKPRENGSVYLSYASSMTPPGTANFNLSTNANNANNPITDPQESYNYEVGTKWEFFKSRLAVNGALFRTINRNEITTDNSATPPTFLFDSERRVDGVEVGLAGKITEEWQVFANFTYMDASFEESANPTQNGATLQWTPELAASFWTTYRFPIRLTIGGGARYVSTIARQTTTTPGALNPESPDYWVLDAIAQYDFNDHFSMRLNVYNLTDEFYPVSLNNNGQRFNPGPPLNAMLTASVSF